MNQQHLNFQLELKQIGEKEFEGHGSIFHNVDLGGDVVVPGAFKRSLARHKAAGTLPQMFWMHKADMVPGAWKEMHEDEKGLFVRGELADTQLGNEIHTLLKMKAVRGLSIGYQTIDSDYDKDGNKLLKEVDLWEVSPVSLAMNPLAKVEFVKSRLSRDGEYVPDVRELEAIFRDGGLSQKQAVTACGILKKWSQRDAGTPINAPRDEVAPEAAEILKALEQSTNSIWSDVFRAR